MSRSSYSDDYDNLQLGRWRGIVASATRGKRGQLFFRDLIAALEVMPDKRLITNELRKDGEVCAIGALGAKRGIELEKLDPEDADCIAATFDIAEPLAREVVYMNDEFFDRLSPEERWHKMLSWAKEQLNTPEPREPGA